MKKVTNRTDGGKGNETKPDNGATKGDQNMKTKTKTKTKTKKSESVKNGSCGDMGSEALPNLAGTGCGRRTEPQLAGRP